MNIHKESTAIRVAMYVASFERVKMWTGGDKAASIRVVQQRRYTLVVARLAIHSMARCIGPPMLATDTRMLELVYNIIMHIQGSNMNEYIKCGVKPHPFAMFKPERYYILFLLLLLVCSFLLMLLLLVHCLLDNCCSFCIRMQMKHMRERQAAEKQSRG